jgi:L-glutamine-phosphate cytidylyltransferase
MTVASLTMTRAIILSAGQGRRLLPLTEKQPKCLLPIAGRCILQWQLDALLESGINNITIITGFHSDLIEQLIAEEYSAHTGITTLYNPFFNVSDNLASCWQARAFMDEDFLLINGDTVFEADVLNDVLASPTAPITLTIDQKETYDEDDMKVELDGLQVRHVSKILKPEQTHAESIGMLYFRGEGPALFREALELAMRKPTGLKSWFLSVVDNLASKNLVQACPISAGRWAEIDFIVDLETAEKLLS